MTTSTASGAAGDAAALEPVQSAAPDGRLPIVIGVTGHRHLRACDLPKHREHVRGLFSQLRRLYPSTPLRILTALAEGADRLVAEVALAEGHELLVPLPLEPSDYERDFPESVAEFRSILRRIPPQHVFVLPETPGDEQLAPRDRREQCYRAVGVFLAQQSHLLLALWDGQQTESTAGTSAVVRLKLEGPSGMPEGGLRPLDADDGGPVYHVHAPRAGETAPVVQQPRWLFPQEADATLFQTLCSRLERFNAEPLRHSRSIRSHLPRAAEELLPDAASRSAGDQTLGAAFATADLLARHYQRLTRGVLKLSLLFAALLALTFELYAEVLPWRALPAGYLAVFASLTGILLWQSRRDVHGRYLDYRALAEGLRVQFYWRLAGLSDNASSSYLRKQLDELRWIREALRAAAALPPPRTSHPELALKHWVGGQAAYYADRAQSQGKRLHRVERGSQLFMGAGLLATAILVVFWNRLETLPLWHRWLVVLMGFAPIAAALWETYAERLGLRAQVNQYARFAGIFRRARRFAEHIDRNPLAEDRHHELVALLRELGREALMENGDWVLLLRERPIVLPKG